MKKNIILLFVSIMLMSGIVLGTAKSNKSHKGKVGKDGVTINCVYCHKSAGIPKKKGLDPGSFKKGPFCYTGDCHQKK